MKLRLHKDSISFRFTGDEVEALVNGKTLKTNVATGPLADPSLTSRATPEKGASDAACVRAQFEDNSLAASLPVQALRTWYEGEELAIEEGQVWATGKP